MTYEYLCSEKVPNIHINGKTIREIDASNLLRAARKKVAQLFPNILA